MPAKRRVGARGGEGRRAPAGVSQVDFDAALAAGRKKGHLTPDELIEALHNVELTPEVLGALLARINAEGVALVEDDVEDAGGRRSRSASNRAAAARTNAASDERRRGARRTASGRPSAESSGSAEDPVHTYLKEIGRVPLLNAALEVEIAQAIEVGNEAAARIAAHELAESGRGAGRRSAEGHRPDARSAAWCARGSRPRTSSSKPTSAWWSPSPSATATAAWPSST